MPIRRYCVMLDSEIVAYLVQEWLGLLSMILIPEIV